MKKLFIFSGSFFLLVLVFLGVYNFAFRNNVSNPIADPMKKAASEKEKGASEAAAEPRSVAFQIGVIARTLAAMPIQQPDGLPTAAAWERDVEAGADHQPQGLAHERGPDEHAEGDHQQLRGGRVLQRAHARLNRALHQVLPAGRDKQVDKRGRKRKARVVPW